MIENIENLIAEKLKQDVEGIKIDCFPDEVNKYPITQSKGVILVRFQDSEYSSPENPICITQKRKIRFLVTISLRKLRNHQGIYFYMDAVIKSLTGWKIPISNVTSRIYPISETFLEYDNNIWTYAILFEFLMLTFENQN